MAAVQALHCAGCGYSLVGVDAVGNGSSTPQTCPECGHPVSSSRRSVVLVYAGDRWLRRLQLGIAAWLLTVVIQTIIGYSFWLDMLRILPLPDLPVWSRLFVSHYVAAGVAYWLLTTPEPARLGDVSHVRRLTVLRWTMLITLACIAIDSYWFPDRSYDGPWRFAATDLVLRPLRRLCWLLLWIRLISLMRRMRRPRVAKWMWCVAAMAVLQIALWFGPRVQFMGALIDGQPMDMVDLLTYRVALLWSYATNASQFWTLVFVGVILATMRRKMRDVRVIRM